jgi:hypothetical protein
VAGRGPSSSAAFDWDDKFIAGDALDGTADAIEPHTTSQRTRRETKCGSGEAVDRR